MIRDKLKSHKQLVYYGIIGICGVTIDFLIFLFLVKALNIPPVLATVISTTCGITNNFFLNRTFNFKRKDQTLSRFVLFYSVGLFGIILSVLSLVIFSDIFGFSSTVVKAISLPIIVLLQYVLNKTVTFSDQDFSFKRVGNFFRRNVILLIINAVFLSSCLWLAHSIPLITNTVGAPDEYQHYQKNVEFMIANHRLPVSGKDDISSLSNCHDNQYGKLPCLYSYQIYPQFNYVTSATTAVLGHKVGLSYLFSARVASILWGLLFINLVYLTSRMLLSRKMALALTVIVGFIPQVLFSASYVNQDIHSLALAMLLVYASVRYLYFGDKRIRLLFYISFGLLFSAKYNYFIIAAVPVLLLAKNYWQQKEKKVFVREPLLLVVAALLLSGGWYIRNYILYNDALGQTFVLQEMAKYHDLGRALSLFDIRSYYILFHFDFFNKLFESFFASFGYLYIQLKESYYTLLKIFILLSALILFCYGNKKTRIIISATAVFITIAVIQVIYNAFTYDYQPQGRYVFVILPVVVLAAAEALQQIRQEKPDIASGLLLSGVAVIILINLESAYVLISALGKGV